MNLKRAYASLGATPRQEHADIADVIISRVRVRRVRNYPSLPGGIHGENRWQFRKIIVPDLKELDLV
jgi:hypothetical protein